jgi:hypothetical protein
VGAGVRANRWSAGRRVLYAGGCVLVPALRLKRVLGGLSSAQRAAIPLRRTLPMLVVGLAIDAAGQLAGFLWPAAEPARDAAVELERVRFIRPSDAAALP